MPEAYAVCCYSLGASSPSSHVWLKKEVVAVEILVKMLGTTQEKAAITRQSMQLEVERIMKMYDVRAPLWEPNYTYANGSPRRRRISGIKDVMISGQSNQKDTTYARGIVQVTCKNYS